VREVIPRLKPRLTARAFSVCHIAPCSRWGSLIGSSRHCPTFSLHKLADGDNPLRGRAPPPRPPPRAAAPARCPRALSALASARAAAAALGPAQLGVLAVVALLALVGALGALEQRASIPRLFNAQGRERAPAAHAAFASAEGFAHALPA